MIIFFYMVCFVEHNDMALWGRASVMISLFWFGCSLFRWLVYPQPFFQGVPRVLEVGGFPNPAAWGVEQPYVGSVHPLKIVSIPSNSGTPFTFLELHRQSGQCTRFRFTFSRIHIPMQRRFTGEQGKCIAVQMTFVKISFNTFYRGNREWRNPVSQR